jgi:hypothetical protein
MLITAIDLQGCLMRSPGLMILASFLVDNSTLQGGQAAVGTYQFTDTALGIRKYVVNGERTCCILVSIEQIFMIS